MYCPLAISVHAGTETDRAAVSQPEPAPCLTLKSEKPQECNSFCYYPSPLPLPDGLPQKIAARLPVSPSLTHTH